MHGLNEALEVLRTTLPNSSDAKMTKIETLRYACNYISALAASVKLLEQNKDRHDFGNELPNPDDYAFMLNFQYSSENSEDIPQNSHCSLASMPRNSCEDDDGSFGAQIHSRVPQVQHIEGNINHISASHAQIIPSINSMDMPSNTDTFLYQEDAVFQQLHNNSLGNKQQDQRQLQGNPNMQFSCFLNAANKNRIASPTFDNMLNSMSNRYESFYDTHYSSIPQTSLATSLPYNTPPTSPESIKQSPSHHQGNHQQQHRSNQISLSMSAASNPNNFLFQQQHQDLQLQHKLQPYPSNHPIGNQSVSSSTLAMISAQFL